jgi:hypothetical protein
MTTMALEYARLDLLREIPASNGAVLHTIVVSRPTVREMAEIIDKSKFTDKVETFISSCCRGLNGTNELLQFRPGDLDSQDVTELQGAFSDMVAEGGTVKPVITGGDGFDEPIVYTLQRPIKLNEETTISQIKFEARKLGEISEFLDASGEREEFPAFMRTFGQMLGTTLPMTDGIINAIDFIDYLLIKDAVVGKLWKPRGRLKKTSTS